MSKKTGGLCTAVVIALIMAFMATPRADQAVSASFNLPVRLTTSVSFDCQNSPGPTITLNDGVLALGGVEAQVTLANNAKFTHYTDPGIIMDAAVMIDMGAPISIPKQPSHEAPAPLSGTGVGGNPWIYAEFTDQQGAPVRGLDGSALGPVLLGRCVQGAANVNVDMLNAVLASATIGTDGSSCTNNPGPFIYLDNGSIVLSGLYAKVIFTNNAKFTHEARGDADVSIELLPPNTTFTVPKQPVLGGAGGNPWVYFLFLTNGDAVGTWPGQLLGRCNKI